MGGIIPPIIANISTTYETSKTSFSRLPRSGSSKRSFAPSSLFEHSFVAYTLLARPRDLHKRILLSPSFASP